MSEKTWAHWCHNQEPVHLPMEILRCELCGAINYQAIKKEKDGEE